MREDPIDHRHLGDERDDPHGAMAGGTRERVDATLFQQRFVAAVSMTRATIAEARAFQSWLDCQDALKRAVGSLTADQLQWRPLAGRRTAGELAEHIVYGRAFHLRRILGVATHELTPFLSWESAGDPARSGREIVRGLEATWQIIVNELMRGDADAELDHGQNTRNQEIWGLLDHDLPHAGQLSLLLRAAELPGVSI
jgi:hypothetical protein